MKRLLPAALAAFLLIWAVPLSVFAAVDPKDPEFQKYLEEIGMSEKAFITYFKETHDYSLDDFDSVDEIREYLGEPITDETLSILLADYGLSKSELEDLLAENGDSIGNYYFIDDLEEAMLDSIFGAIDEDEVINALAEFGITPEEAEALGAHIANVIANSDQDALMAKLGELADRLMAFPDFESSSELTPAQMAELVNIWNELMDLFELKVEYYLVKDGVEKPISLTALIQMDTVDGADLLIKIYSKDGTFLADILITKEMFGSEMLNDAGQKIEKAETVVKTASGKPAVKKASGKTVPKTVKGGKLPNTDGGYVPQAIAGMALIAAGAFLFRRLKVKGA